MEEIRTENLHCPFCGNDLYDDYMSNDYVDSITCSCGKTLRIVDSTSSLLGYTHQASIPSLYIDVTPTDTSCLVGIHPPSNVIRDINMTLPRVGMVADITMNDSLLRGIISKVRKTKKKVSYDVEYDNGQFEEQVVRSRIQICGEKFRIAERCIKDSGYANAIVLPRHGDISDALSSLHEAQSLLNAFHTPSDADDVLTEVASTVDEMSTEIEDAWIALQRAQTLLHTIQSMLPLKEVIVLYDSDCDGTQACPIEL